MNRRALPWLSVSVAFVVGCADDPPATPNDVPTLAEAGADAPDAAEVAVDAGELVPARSALRGVGQRGVEQAEQRAVERVV